MIMSVAKSYEKYELLDEPYKKDGRPYVHIQYPCCKRKSCAKWNQKCSWGGKKNSCHFQEQKMDKVEVQLSVIF